MAGPSDGESAGGVVCADSVLSVGACAASGPFRMGLTLVSERRSGKGWRSQAGGDVVATLGIAGRGASTPRSKTLTESLR